MNKQRALSALCVALAILCASHVRVVSTFLTVLPIIGAKVGQT
jgi:hypothetical protein